MPQHISASFHGCAMSFLRPKVSSAAQPAPPPPVIEDTSAAQQEQADMLRRRKGRASAILSERNTPVQTAGKTLLGQ